MLGMIGYVIACFVVAVIATVIVSLFRPIKKHDSFLSWRVMIGLHMFFLAAPYGYVEFMTNQYGEPMKDAVEETLLEGSPKGELQYYKVISFKEDKARVIAVGLEEARWGGMEKPVMAINMEKKDGQWESVEFNWVTSDDRGHDSVSLPPYW